jgi:transposase
MESVYWIGLDVHSQFCQYCWQSPAGRRGEEGRLPTRLPALIQLVQRIKQPRVVVMEESTLSSWLMRGLTPFADQVIVCDPRRNHLIACDGEKTDKVDARELINLARSGHIRPVHHPLDDKRAALKSHLAMYERQVRDTVATGNCLTAWLRSWGIVVSAASLLPTDGQQAVSRRLPSIKLLQEDFQQQVEIYRYQAEQLDEARRRLVGQTRQYELVGRFQALPGIGPVRALTFYVHVDTPWRFPNKNALWKYMGIGLEHRQSGNGPMRRRLPKRFNRPLKAAIMGAARHAAAQKHTPFGRQYDRLIARGQSKAVARRTVARSQAAVMWAMWKTQSVYREDWVGVPAEHLER